MGIEWVLVAVMGFAFVVLVVLGLVMRSMAAVLTKHNETMTTLIRQFAWQIKTHQDQQVELLEAESGLPPKTESKTVSVPEAPNTFQNNSTEYSIL